MEIKNFQEFLLTDIDYNILKDLDNDEIGELSSSYDYIINNPIEYENEKGSN